jgi:chromosome partitioning protein
MVRRGRIFESCLDALRQEAKLPILKATVAMRNAYPESQPYGCVVRSFGKNPAATEMDEVTAEVAALAGITLPKGQK